VSRVADHSGLRMQMDHRHLQIVESAQVDVDNEDQNNIFKNSTHFNPVDLVCGVKNGKGELYDLKKFRDPLTGFITGNPKTVKI
jgi:hypothetical protein